ncbi:MAG: hypothetical protein KAI66_26145, partial [Lentisphaeria bacterium]|nr:hypothetical protein [Lentisphaeria bacterium]
NGCEVEQSDFHCASCDDNCTEGPNAEPGTCLEETDRCDYDCDDHYMDCDSAAWGCETDIRNPTTCGDCPGGDVDDCTLGEVDLLCLYDSVNAEYYCGCDVAANHHGNNQDNPDGNVLCGDTQICCVVDDKGTCVEHDAEHCFDCGVGTPSVCNPAVGGIYCIPAEAGGPWGCTCFEDGTSQDHESCRNYDFSVALCSQATELCICGETPNGCLTPDACCITASGLGCTDLANDKLNCGMCGVVCESESCGVVEGGGRPGACNWSDAEICPSPSGAPDRNADGYCDCNFFDAQPCPIGQYCVSNRGCCPLSDSPAEDCSIACIDAGNEWCNDGTCAAVGACPS